jgi:hypothetical protein
MRVTSDGRLRPVDGGERGRQITEELRHGADYIAEPEKPGPKSGRGLNRETVVREVAVHLSQGKTVEEACRTVGVALGYSDKTIRRQYYGRRPEPSEPHVT